MNFILGRNPRIIKYNAINTRRYIPKPYKAVFLLCADFELAWAWRFAKALPDQKQDAIQLARQARENIPLILELCDEYDIPITWATVGHLFLERCNKNGNLAHAQMERLSYHENQYWKFEQGDWFDNDPCSDWQTSPEWYAPDLIKMISSSKTKHEIACHTFSHIDCRDGVCPSQILAGEIRECQNLAQKYDIRLESFVHPGHTIGNLDTLKELGFTSFRTDYRNILGYPKKHSNGLWEFQSTAELYYRKEWSIDYHIRRYRNILDRAIKHNRVAYFWFHPTFDKHFITSVMQPVFSYIFKLHRNNEIAVLLTRDYVDYLNVCRSKS